MADEEKDKSQEETTEEIEETEEVETKTYDEKFVRELKKEAKDRRLKLRDVEAELKKLKDEKLSDSEKKDSRIKDLEKEVENLKEEGKNIKLDSSILASNLLYKSKCLTSRSSITKISPFLHLITIFLGYFILSCFFKPSFMFFAMFSCFVNFPVFYRITKSLSSSC